MGRGHRGIHAFSPGKQFGIKFRRAARLRRGQVVLFARVISQVVKLALARFEKLEQLPVAYANGSGRGRSPASRAGTK